jgi:hypothetical protein
MSDKYGKYHNSAVMSSTGWIENDEHSNPSTGLGCLIGTVLICAIIIGLAIYYSGIM